MTNGRVLVVDDEPIAVKNLAHVLRRDGHSVATATDGATALRLIQANEFDLVLTDLRMEGVDGIRVLQESRATWPDCEVVLITGFATLESAVEVMKQGAFYYIAKPFRLDEVRKVVAEALEKIALKRENRLLRAELSSRQVTIVTHDPGMERLLALARQVAPSGCNVIITGESGTGKELVARYIHQHGGAPAAPLVAVNCGALTEELLANELFGHEKGAFTGATSARPGLIETADGGTLFLDEITEISPAMQVKLLRVIQEQEVQRVGAVTPLAVRVRFVAATNRDPRAAVSDGRLRNDLYYRLNVVTLDLPPLARRQGDVPLLANHFLRKHAALQNKGVERFTPEALTLLEGYGFPGNVRELENLVERAVALSNSTVVGIAQLPDDLKHLPFATLRRANQAITTLEEQEREYILWVLEQVNGNRNQAAQMLGIDRVSLWRKLKRFGVTERE